jgi:site-specific DNA-methyltransferase (cytosine-N4-specific)
MPYLLVTADARQIPLRDESVQCVVTSPPYYGLRNYGVPGQIGLEATPEEYVSNIVSVLREVRRVLRRDGTVWLNLGDTYTNIGRDTYHKGSFNSRIQATTRYRFENERRNLKGHPIFKDKDLMMIPHRVAIAAQEDGWWVRCDIVWDKPNALPEPVKDRPTHAHEYIFLLTKSRNYYYNADAIREPIAQARQEHSRLRNKRSVWRVPSDSFKDAHFAVFPPALIEPCILAGSRPGDIVLDPFSGSGTTGFVCAKHGRIYIGIDINRDYHELAKKRIEAESQQEKLFFL